MTGLGRALKEMQRTPPQQQGAGVGQGRSLLSCEWRVGLQSNSVKDRESKLLNGLMSGVCNVFSKAKKKTQGDSIGRLDNW